MKKFLSTLFIAILTLGVGFAATSWSGKCGNKVSYANLPDATKQVLIKYFPGEKIQGICAETEQGVTEYDVRFVNGIKLEINDQGIWDEVCTRNADIPMAMLPDNVTNYLATNYPGVKVTKIEKDRKGYEVTLTTGIELEFDLNGNFLKIDK